MQSPRLLRVLPRAFALAGMLLGPALPRLAAGELLLSQDFETYAYTPASFPLPNTETISRPPLSTSVATATAQFRINAAPAPYVHALLGKHYAQPGNAPGGGNTNIYAAVKQKGRFTLKFAFHPVDFNAELRLNVRVNNSGGTSVQLARITKAGQFIPNSNGAALNGLATAVTPNTWHRLAITFDTDAGTYDLHLDSSTSHTGLLLPDPPANSPKSLFAAHGMNDFLIQRATTSPAASSMYYDNFSIVSGADPDAPVDFPSENPAPGQQPPQWFHPAHLQSVQQNPPAFRWPHHPQAGAYVLQLATDPAMTGAVVITPDNHAPNYLNHTATLAPGLWYWRVGFTSVAGASAWSETRRFRIEPDAPAFIVPDPGTLKAALPASGPRIWTNSQDLAAFRARRFGPASAFYPTVRARVEANIDTPLPAAPVTPASPGADSILQQTETATTRLLEGAFVSLIEGPATELKGINVRQQSIARLLNLASWPLNPNLTFDNQDQAYRLIPYAAAIAYDWLKDGMSPADRAAVLAMIKTRTGAMFTKHFVTYPIHTRPFDSHGWTAIGYMSVISLAVHGEFFEASDNAIADRWFDTILPFYLNAAPVWGGEDGGFGNGTGYWAHGTRTSLTVRDALYSATGTDLQNKAAARNEYLFPLYFYPNGSPTGIFGDDHNLASTSDVASVIKGHSWARHYRNGVAKWLANHRRTQPPPRDNILYYAQLDDSVPEQAPAGFPTARHSRDIGWVALHSDLIDEERVSLYFRSSPYGSHNHSHADQNAFVINAYGQSLAIDSGYYDEYGSPHDLGFAHRTHAHNAITYDGGQGQQFDPGQPETNILSKGTITGFVSHPAFDATSGDATPAYRQAFARARRHVIFLKPSTFITVDDLAATPGATRRFEWNLHAVNEMTWNTSDHSLLVSRNAARLKAAIRYPDPTTLAFSQTDKFLGASNPSQEVPPANGRPNQWHARLATPPQAAAVIVGTLDVYRASGAPRPIASNAEGGCLKLVIDDYTAYVRLSAYGPVTRDGVTFDGAAAVFHGDAFLLVDGVSLTKDGVPLVAVAGPSPSPLTLSSGEGAIDVHSSRDATVTIHAPGIGALLDAKGRLLPEGPQPTALSAIAATPAPGDKIVLALEAGGHALRTPGFGPVVTPVIVRHPDSATVVSGSSIRFDALATGGGLVYQWFRDGQEIAGAHAPSLTLENAQAADAGAYSVRVMSARHLPLGDAGAVAAHLPVSRVFPSGAGATASTFGFDTSRNAALLNALPAAGTTGEHSVSAYGHADRSADLNFFAGEKTISFQNIKYERDASGGYFARFGLQGAVSDRFTSNIAPPALFFDLSSGGIRLLYKAASTYTTVPLATFSTTAVPASLEFSEVTLTLTATTWAAKFYSAANPGTIVHEGSGAFSPAASDWTGFLVAARAVSNQSAVTANGANYYCRLALGGVDIRSAIVESQPAELVVSEPPPLAYADWIEGRGLAGSQLAPAADPDGDGLANLLEFALAGDPADPASAPAPRARIIREAGLDHLALQVEKNPAAACVYLVEVSSDLTHWFSGPGHTLTLLETAATLLVRDATPLAPGLRRFIRLRITPSTA